MQLHELKPKHKPKKRKRVGRGGKRGTYSGRGMKGQKSRAGHRFEPVVRGLIKKYPKLKGYRFKSRAKIRGLKIETINLEILEKNFKSEEKINPQILLEKKLISKMKGKLPHVKILGRGKLTKKLIVEGCAVSKSAKEEIEKVGGKINS